MEAMTTIKSMWWMRVVICVAVLAIGASALAETAATPKKTTKSKSTAKSSSAKSSAGRASLPNRTADPCLGSIVVDAETGKVLAEQNADAAGFPASVIKLMDMMVLLDQISAGQISLSNSVTVTAESSRIGGSQVYLKEGEVFLLEDLMYALMIQSANDAAMAMALSVAGSSAGFVDMMNKKAGELGMSNTTFHSVHGLPPASGQSGDTSTPRDLAKLACALIAQHPEVLAYTSTQVRDFRPDAPKPFVMRSHNHLLRNYPGCDGLKTGFINAGGYSIVATAQKNGRRVIAVVMGSKDRKVRDAKATELLSKGFAALPPLPPPPPPVVNPVTTNLVAALPVTDEAEVVSETPHMGWLKVAGIGLVVGLVALAIGGFFLKKRSRNDF
jgi:D-alanyl-D-alanine carboxypeptidase (penicillin-binding protein 5/6)